MQEIASCHCICQETQSSFGAVAKTEQLRNSEETIFGTSKRPSSAIGMTTVEAEGLEGEGCCSQRKVRHTPTKLIGLG